MGVVYGAMEIDNPRRTLYLKNVHGIESSMALSNDQIIARVFRAGKV